MEHIDWNHILNLIFTVLAAYFGGNHGARNGNGH